MSERNNTPTDSRLEIGMVADSAELSQDVVAGESNNQSRYNARLEAYVSLFESRLENENDSTLLSEFISYLALKAQNNSTAQMSDTLKEATVRQIGVIRQFRSFVKRRVETSRASATENLDDKINALIASKKLIDVSSLSGTQLAEAVNKLEARGYSKNEACNWWEPPSVLTPPESTTSQPPAEFDELKGDMDADAETLLTKFNEKFKELNQPHKNLYESNLDAVLNTDIPDSVEFSDEMTNAQVSEKFSGAVQNYNVFTSRAQEYQSSMSNVFSEVNFMMQGLNAFITKHQSGAWNYLKSYFNSLEESCPVYREVKEKLEAKVRMFFYSNGSAKILYGENEFSADSSFLRARKAQIQDKAKKHKDYYDMMLAAYKARIERKNEKFADQVSKYEAQEGKFNDVLRQKQSEANDALTDLETRRSNTLQRVDDENSIPALRVIGIELGIDVPAQARDSETIKTFLRTSIDAKFDTEKQELDSRKEQLDNDQRRFALSHELLNAEIRNGNEQLRIMENEYEQMFDMKADIFGSSEEESQIGQITEGITSLSRSIEGITRNDSDYDDIELKLQHPNWLSAICSTRLLIPGLTLGNIITAAGQTIKVAVNTIAGAARLVGNLVAKAGSYLFFDNKYEIGDVKAMFQTNYSMELMNLGMSMAKMSVHDMMEMLPSWAQNETIANTLVAITRWGAIAPTIVGGLLTAVQDGNSLAHALGDIVNLQTLATRMSVQTLGDAVGYTSEVADNTDSWGEGLGSIGAGLGYLALNFTGAGAAGNGGRLAAIGARMSFAARGGSLGARFALGAARATRTVARGLTWTTRMSGRAALGIPKAAKWAVGKTAPGFVRYPAQAVRWTANLPVRGVRAVGRWMVNDGTWGIVRVPSRFVRDSVIRSVEKARSLPNAARMFYEKNPAFSGLRRLRNALDSKLTAKSLKQIEKIHQQIETAFQAGNKELCNVLNARLQRQIVKLSERQLRVQRLASQLNDDFAKVVEKLDDAKLRLSEATDDAAKAPIQKEIQGLEQQLAYSSNAFEELLPSIIEFDEAIASAHSRYARNQTVINSMDESSSLHLLQPIDDAADDLARQMPESTTFIDDFYERPALDDLSSMNLQFKTNIQRVNVPLDNLAFLGGDDLRLAYQTILDNGLENILRTINENINNVSNKNMCYNRLNFMLESLEQYFSTNGNINAASYMLRGNIRTLKESIFQFKTDLLRSKGLSIGNSIDDSYRVVNINGSYVYKSNANPSIGFFVDENLNVWKADISKGRIVGSSLLKNGDEAVVISANRVEGVLSNLDEMLSPSPTVADDVNMSNTSSSTSNVAPQSEVVQVNNPLAPPPIVLEPPVANLTAEVAEVVVNTTRPLWTTLKDCSAAVAQGAVDLAVAGSVSVVSFTFLFLKQTYNLTDDFLGTLFENSISQLPPSLLGTLQLQIENQDSRRRIGGVISDAVAQGKTISEINNLLVSELESLKQTQRLFYEIESSNEILSNYFNTNNDTLFKFNGKSLLDGLTGNDCVEFNRLRSQARLFLFGSSTNVLNSFQESRPGVIDVNELILIRAAIILKSLTGNEASKIRNLKDQIRSFVLSLRHTNNALIASSNPVYIFIYNQYVSTSNPVAPSTPSRSSGTQTRSSRSSTGGNGSSRQRKSRTRTPSPRQSGRGSQPLSRQQLLDL